MNTKKWWQLTKALMGKFSDSTIPPITDIVHNVTLFDAKAKSELFNKSFLLYTEPDATNAQLPPTVIKKTESTLSEINVTVKEVIDILLSIDTSKAT